MLKKWSETQHLIVPGDLHQTITYAVEHFLGVGQAAIRAKGVFFVALSGGSTPKAIFQKLFHPPYKEMLAWEKVHFFFSDERSCLPSDKDSNYKMALDAGLEGLSIAESQIHRMVAEENIEENARVYDLTIRRILGKHPFDLIMLGVGEDGHTASLFPGTEALHVYDRNSVANFVAEKNSWRMTMTYPCLNSALHPVFYVLGASKKEIVSSIFHKKKQGEKLYPAEKVGTIQHPAFWILDKEAASGLCFG